MVSQKEREYNKIKGEVVELEMKLSSKNGERVALDEAR
jgi:hypothetical protein